MADSGRSQLQAFRSKALQELQTLARMAKENKGRVPMLIHDSREWTDRIASRVDGIDRWMTHSERTLTQGFASVRQTLQGLRAQGDDFEEKMWYLHHYPWALIQPPRDMEGFALDTFRRKDLLARHYEELRGELDRARKALKPSDSSDQARVARINQIIQEVEPFLLAPLPVARPAR
jgi:hypothetical protein